MLRPRWRANQAPVNLALREVLDTELKTVSIDSSPPLWSSYGLKGLSQSCHSYKIGTYRQKECRTRHNWIQETASKYISIEDVLGWNIGSFKNMFLWVFCELLSDLTCVFTLKLNLDNLMPKFIVNNKTNVRKAGIVFQLKLPKKQRSRLEHIAILITVLSRAKFRKKCLRGGRYLFIFSYNFALRRYVRPLLTSLCQTMLRRNLPSIRKQTRSRECGVNCFFF